MNEELNAPWNSVDTEADKLRKELKLRDAEIAKRDKKLAEVMELLEEVYHNLDFMIDSSGWNFSREEDKMVQDMQSKIRKLMEEGK